MRTPDNDLKADIRLVVGSTGSGKSHGTKQAMKGERSVFVFDVKNEYGAIPGFRIVHTRRELVAAAERGGRVAWPACSAEDFDFWAAVVWARGDCLCVAEELAGLATSSGKARGYWHKILTQGRGFGIRTVGLSQRPQEIDKTIVGQATLMRVHRLSRAGDQKYMAAELNVPVELVADLQGFEVIERHVIENRIVLPRRLEGRMPVRKNAQNSGRKAR